MVAIVCLAIPLIFRVIMGPWISPGFLRGILSSIGPSSRFFFSWRGDSSFAPRLNGLRLRYYDVKEKKMLRVLHHVCLETNCYEKSLRFYLDVLGFSVIRESADFRGRRYNTWLKNVDILIELQTPKRYGRLPTFNFVRGSLGINHICFLVDDIVKEVSRISSLGYTAFKKKDDSFIYQVDGVSLCKVVAPEGTVIELREQDICF